MTVYHRLLNRVLCAQGPLWGLRSMHPIHLLTPTSHFIPPLPSLSATTCLFSMSLTPLLFILAVQSLHCYVGFSPAVSGGHSLAAITGFSPRGFSHLRRALAGVAYGVSCAAWACLPHSLWNLPGPGIEPWFHPALTGGFLTTGPRGKSLSHTPEHYLIFNYKKILCNSNDSVYFKGI